MPIRNITVDTEIELHGVTIVPAFLRHITDARRWLGGLLSSCADGMRNPYYASLTLRSRLCAAWLICSGNPGESTQPRLGRN